LPSCNPVPAVPQAKRNLAIKRQHKILPSCNPVLAFNVRLGGDNTNKGCGSRCGATPLQWCEVHASLVSDTPTRAVVLILNVNAKSCHPAILSWLLMFVLVVITPTRAVVLINSPTSYLAESHKILPSCNPVPTVPLSEAKNLAIKRQPKILPSCNPVPAVPLSEAQSCH
jgi:hypothetical protein